MDSYEVFTSTEVMGKMAMERMLAGLPTRRYPAGLEPVGEHTKSRANRPASPRARRSS